MQKAGSNRARGRAGWLRLARHGSACRGLHHPRVLQRHPGRAAWQVGAQLSPATARSGLATQRGLADLHAVSFKTWTQVSKTQSILWGEGHKDRSGIVMVMGPWRRTPSALYSLVRLLEKLFDCPAQRLFVFSLTVPPPPPPVSSTSSFSVSG